MNVLVVDDEDSRHECFEKHLTAAGHCVLHAFNHDEAMEVITSCVEPIGLLCIDHDMGKESKNGSALATEILCLPKDKHPAMVVVHSLNHSGALNIISKFQSAGIHTQYMPFCGDATLGRIVEGLIEQ